MRIVEKRGGKYYNYADCNGSDETPAKGPNQLLKTESFWRLSTKREKKDEMKKISFALTAFCLLTVLASAQTVKTPFCGHCLHEWSTTGANKNVWTIGTAEVDSQDPRGLVVQPAKKGSVPCMVNAAPADWSKEPRQGVDIFTKEKYGDCTVKLEFMLPKGSNSGVYLMGEYEVQVADSFGKEADKLGQGDMGAIYSAAAPKTNACKEPGTWQAYEIEFVAPKFDANGKKIQNAIFKKVVLNGTVVQENVEVEGPTGGGITMKEAATGPLMLQGNHGAVAFRNIEVIVP